MSDWHFPPETRAFLCGLRDNNTRDWFEAHRDAYQRHWRAPGAAAADLLTAELDGMTGRRHLPKVFRIHRDVRFARGQPPYKAHLHMIFHETPAAGLSPALFFGLEPDRIRVGGGVPALEGPALDRFRQAVASPRGKELADIVAAATAEGSTLWEPALKTVPRGYTADHPRAALLRHKALVMTLAPDDPARAEAPGFVALVRQGFARMMPLIDWLRDS